MDHIVTVGTSVLSNARRQGIATDRTSLGAFVAQRPREASAEINAMGDYLDRGSVGSVYLLATDTPDGALCADLVEEHLRSRGVRVSRGPRILGAADPDAFYAGLSDLVLAVARYIRRHERDGVLINATGGYKAESAMVTSLGLTLGVAVYYQHESATRAVVLPPIGLDSGRAALALRELDGRMVGPDYEAWRARHEGVVERLSHGLAVEILIDDDGRPFGCELTQLGRTLRTWLGTLYEGV